MAKKQEEQTRRRSRKEVLLERRHERQTRQVRMAVGAIVALLALVLIVALVIEYGVRPRQPVATVNEATITLRDWQNRVRYQRAQFIIALEDQLEAFQDISLVQQFSQQQISLLQQPELLGELVLEQMIDEELVRQAAIARGIRVTDEEVEARIAEGFNYFGGESPTPLPTPTETIEPTPSLTPIPTEVITDVLPTNTPFPTPEPVGTATPRPTATPVSEEAYQSELSALLDRYREFGISAEVYRSVVRAQLYREKLADQLAEVEGIPAEEEMASLYVLSFSTEEQAQAALEQIEEEAFLTVWNRLRTPPSDPDTPPAGSASEVLWRTADQVQQQLGAQVSEAAFELPIGEPSGVLVQGQPDAEGVEDPSVPARYHIIQVSGREVRELGESVIQTRKQELVSELLEEQREGGLAMIERNPLWRARVPRQPILDPSFLAPPAQPTMPQQPPITVEAPAPVEDQ